MATINQQRSLSFDGWNLSTLMERIAEMEAVGHSWFLRPLMRKFGSSRNAHGKTRSRLHIGSGTFLFVVTCSQQLNFRQLRSYTTTNNIY